MRSGRLDVGFDESALELVETITALERDLILEQGTLIRELTEAVTRRRRLEGLRRDYDIRFR